jgi:sulfoxide reductase heme-binding subunit YedZ
MVFLAWLKRNWLRVVVHIGSLVPLALMAWDYSQGSFLVDPVKEITTRTGKTALILLILSLACTPINTVSGFRGVLRVRRALGVYAFVYAAVHFLAFVWLDYALDLELILLGILDDQFVLVGLAGGLILLALALTSTKGWQRRLRKNWKRLHRLVYLAGPLVILHFLWLSKDDFEPLSYGLLLALLLALRIPPVRRAVSKARRSLAAARGSPTKRDTVAG